MPIKYSVHLQVRLALREILKDLPRTILRYARRRYYDIETGLFIAVQQVLLRGKQRNVMIAHRTNDYGDAFIVTIHPLKRNQELNRLASGRWDKI